MNVLFPRVSTNYDFNKNDRRCEPRDYVGNPKAVAAQTYKAKQTGLKLFKAKPWASFCQIFTIQYLIEKERAPTIMMPDENAWIMYPYALNEIADDRVCLVWREQVEPRWIRHVRVYNNEANALSDNHLIVQSLHASLHLI